MPQTVEQRAHRWGLDIDPEFISLLSQIQYHAHKRYREYQPAFGPPHSDFMARLEDWLDGAPDDDQRTLFRIVPRLFFISSLEFASLHRSAFRGPVMRWLIESLGISLDNPGLSAEISGAVAHTWFCAITDSMQIAAFYHYNHIEGNDLRPDWRTLRCLGDRDRIAQFMATNGLTRIVLLEDFIGSGSQMSRAVEFAAQLPNSPQVLVVPLVISPAGLEVGRQMGATYRNVKFDPVLELQKEVFVCEAPSHGEEGIVTLIRDLVVRLYETVSGGVPADDNVKPYGPFGWGISKPKYGSLLVMYTNCPDNTLPIIHHGSATWKALFPRSSRI